MLSSLISAVAKFEPTSMNVGKLPVVMPFNRCRVVVGASATNFMNRALCGCAVRILSKTGNLFSNGKAFTLSGYSECEIEIKNQQ